MNSLLEKLDDWWRADARDLGDWSSLIRDLLACWLLLARILVGFLVALVGVKPPDELMTIKWRSPRSHLRGLVSFHDGF